MLRGWMLRTLLVATFSMVAMQGLRPMVTYRALELGASTVQLGFVAGSFAVLSVVFAAPLGRWIDRLGEARFLLAGTSLATLTAVGLALADSLVTLMLAQALLGLGQVATLVGLQTLVANGGRKEGRDARFGAFTVVASLTQMVGPTLAGYAYDTDGFTLRSIFLAGAMVCTISIGLAITLLLRPPARHQELRAVPRTPQEPFLRSVRGVMAQPAVPHAMLASLAVLTSIDLLIAYLPAYGEANAIPAGTIGLMLGVRAAGGMASRLLMMRLLRRSTRRRLLVQSMLLPAIALLLLPTTANTVVLVALLGVAGYGLGLGQPLSMGWISDQVPRETRGTALGVRITGNRLAQLVVPIGVGAIAGATGIGAIFVTAGLLLGASSVVVARAPTTGHRPAPDDPPPGAAPTGAS